MDSWTSWARLVSGAKHCSGPEFVLSDACDRQPNVQSPVP